MESIDCIFIVTCLELVLISWQRENTAKIRKLQRDLNAMDESAHRLTSIQQDLERAVSTWCQVTNLMSSVFIYYSLTWNSLQTQELENLQQAVDTEVLKKEISELNTAKDKLAAQVGQLGWVGLGHAILLWSHLHFPVMLPSLLQIGAFSHQSRICRSCKALHVSERQVIKGRASQKTVGDIHQLHRHSILLLISSGSFLPGNQSTVTRLICCLELSLRWTCDPSWILTSGLSFLSIWRFLHGRRCQSLDHDVFFASRDHTARKKDIEDALRSNQAKLTELETQGMMHQWV